MGADVSLMVWLGRTKPKTKMSAATSVVTTQPIALTAAVTATSQQLDNSAVGLQLRLDEIGQVMNSTRDSRDRLFVATQLDWCCEQYDILAARADSVQNHYYSIASLAAKGDAKILSGWRRLGPDCDQSIVELFAHGTRRV